MEITSFTDGFQKSVVKLVLKIQNEEAKINLPLSEQLDLNNIKSAYQDSGGGFWIALNEVNEVVGTIGLMNMKNGYGILKKFFVRQDYRKQKLGWKLYRQMLQFAFENNYTTLILDSPSIAAASHRFYEKNGFQRIEKKDLPIKYTYPDRDCLLYIKELSV